MANFKKNDEAVSAVIGVILMVAITVILAAVIAAFVFQLGGNVPKSKQVGVEVKRTLTAGVISVKTMSGADVGLLKDGSDGAATPTWDAIYTTYTCTVNGKEMWPCEYIPGTGAANFVQDSDTAFKANKIGSAIFFGNITDDTANAVPTNADVTVIAHFTDGTDYPAWSGNLA